MRTILVDDELWMLEQFEDECNTIPDIQVVGKFDNPVEALAFAAKEHVDLAFLDVEMKEMNGIELANELRRLYPLIIIIFVSAHDSYMPEAFRTGADYYIMKPYTKTDVEAVLKRAELLSGRLKKRITIHTFGRFNVYVDGQPVKITSPKAKELLALLVDRRGATLGNEEAFYYLWEDRPYDHANAVAYHNVLRRLRNALDAAGIGDILISLSREHKINVDMVDCDYYKFMDGDENARKEFDGRYMTEYSWGEETVARLCDMVDMVY